MEVNMTSKDLSIFNSLRPFSIGFDDMFDQFESMLGSGGLSMQSNYPPYNIVKTGDYTYDIELALAGFGKKDIDVNYADSQLTIKSIKDEKAEEDADGVLHKGISKRQFSRSFTIADDVEVKGAELKDGLLKVSLEKIIPDSKKPRTIQIK